MLFLFSVSWENVSGWWLPACLLLGIVYAWLMYRQPINLTQTYRWLLAALRAITVFFIALLLLSPLVKTVSYQPQKPLILVVQDNSASVRLFEPAAFSGNRFISDLGKLQQQLGEQYEVRQFHFDKHLSAGLSDKFDGRQTDIAATLRQLNERFVNQNIGALILATDGLYNQGSDPGYEAHNIKTTFYTIALGDTIPRRDLLISNVSYNKTAFLGNDFMVEVLTEAYQSKGENIRLTVSEDGRPVANQSIPVSTAAFKKVVPIKLTADKKGIHKFTIAIAPVSNEISTENNSETIYVEVLDARQKILIVYDHTHPDIGVIKQSLESNANYQVKAVQVKDLASVKPADYSLVILHQLTETNAGIDALINKTRVPVWFMAGIQSNLPLLNQEQKLVQIAVGRSDAQEVFAVPQSGFSSFTLSDSTQKKLAQLPPLLAPFGNYKSPGNVAVLLKQRIGNISTDYPLLAFAEEGGRREAVLTGEGLWRWQLTEFETFGNHHAVEELIGQSVQYLTANANHQRFRVYPAKNVFDEGENVLLNAELYNAALQLTNTPDVKIEIRSSAGKDYSFLFSRSGQSYQLDAGSLPPGDYTFNTTTKLGNDNLTASGRFTVKSLDLERRQSAANHQLLQQLVRQSGGIMLQPSQISRLADLIRKNDNIKTISYEDRRYNDLIDIKWVFVWILTLLSAEWFLRKREGEV